MDFVVPIALKWVATDANFLNFFVAHFAALLDSLRRASMNLQPFGSRRTDRFTTISCVSRGTPCQLRVMWQNNRCSILFHLLVPGGK